MLRKYIQTNLEKAHLMKKILLLLVLASSLLTARQSNTDFEKLDYLLKRYEYATRLRDLNGSGGFGAKKEYIFDPKFIGETFKKTENELLNAIYEYFQIKN